MNEILQAWLTMQCQLIAGASRAMFVLASTGEQGLEMVAVWPDAGGETPGLSAAAETAASKGRYVVRGIGARAEDVSKGEIIAFPLKLDNRLLGVVAVEMSSRSEQQRRMVAKLLKVGSTWLALMLEQQRADRSEHLALVVNLLAECLEKVDFQAAATLLVNRLAAQMVCSRVSLGVYQDNYHQVRVISHSARTDRRSNLVKDISAAMDESRDQGCSLIYPVPEGARAPIVLAHGELSRRHLSRAICSVPLQADGRVVGTITLERREEIPIEQETVRLCEQIALLMGPVLDLNRRAERRLPGRVRDAMQDGLKALIGPGHLLFKLSVVVSTGLSTLR